MQKVKNEEFIEISNANPHNRLKSTILTNYYNIAFIFLTLYLCFIL